MENFTSLFDRLPDLRKPLLVGEITLGDTIYLVTTFFREGVEACSEGIPYHNNPYRQSSQRHEDWNDGHSNQEEVLLNYHMRKKI